MKEIIRYENVENAVNQFMRGSAMPAELGEAVLAIRVVGEFSSGKTRFIREIFKDLIPAELMPVSSLEKQTILPLELTYGDNPSLELIEREYDGSPAKVLAAWDHFPKREELEGRNLANLRLRLFVNEPQLTLAEGDGYEEGKQPQRLRIIDEPGWNSEDEDRGWEELGLSDEWENLGLITVCRSARLDSKTNHQNLEIFLNALLSGDMVAARERLPLFFAITECAKEDREKSIRKQEERIKAILKEKVGKFPLKVVAVDFAKLEPGELETLRQEFWEHILSESPSEPLQNGLNAIIRRWPQE